MNGAKTVMMAKKHREQAAWFQFLENLEPKAPSIFGVATQEARARIHRDAKLFSGDEDVKNLFLYLENHLFDTTLDVNMWLKKSGCSRDTRDRFVARMGSPKAYLDKVRMIAACRLAQEPTLPLETIALLVGFEVQRTFLRTFERVLGQRPSELRAARSEERRSERRKPEAAKAHWVLRHRATYWRRQVTLTWLDAEGLVTLRRHLRQWYPALKNRPEKPPPKHRSTTGIPGAYVIWAGNEVELRDAASAITLKVIFADKKKAPKHLRYLFAEVQDEARDPNQRSFQRLVGQTSSSYLREARHETTARMLIHTELAAKRIAFLMGYATASSFSKAFRNRFGLSPTQYRRQARLRLGRGGPPPWGRKEVKYWRRVVSRRLKTIEVVELDDYLHRLLPPS